MLKYISNKLENSEFPLLSPNICALKFWGLISSKNKVIKWVHLFIHISLYLFTATAYVDICFVIGNKSLLLENVKITLLATVTVVKVVTFLIKQNQWNKIIDYVNKSDKLQRNESDVTKKDIIEKYTKYARKITYRYSILMYSTIVILISQTLYKFTSKVYRQKVREGSEDFPQIFSSWVPYDKNSLSGFMVTFINQCFIAICGAGWIVAFDTNAVVIMIFLRGELEMLRHDSRLIFGSEDSSVNCEEARNRLQKVVKRHVELLKYSRLFDTCLSPIMLHYVLVCSIVICATAYQINIETSTMQKFLTTEFLIYGISQLFMYCWHCNEVFYVSTNLTLGPYESIWWTRDVSEIRDIIILIYQFKRPITFSAGPFTNVTLATFIGILKGAYSYYTLLSQSQED